MEMSPAIKAVFAAASVAFAGGPCIVTEMSGRHLDGCFCDLHTHNELPRSQSAPYAPYVLTSTSTSTSTS
jgi:hypothetical protein